MPRASTDSGRIERPSLDAAKAWPSEEANPGSFFSLPTSEKSSPKKAAPETSCAKTFNGAFFSRARSGGSDRSGVPSEASAVMSEPCFPKRPARGDESESEESESNSEFRKRASRFFSCENACGSRAGAPPSNAAVESPCTTWWQNASTHSFPLASQ